VTVTPVHVEGDAEETKLADGPFKPRRKIPTESHLLGGGPHKRGSRPDIQVIDITSSRQGAFAVALKNASSGAHILYHLGEYCAGPHRVDARVAYENGHVILTTRKRNNSQFEHIAILRNTKQK
jgi:hypothetical protein